MIKKKKIIKQREQEHSFSAEIEDVYAKCLPSCTSVKS